MSSGGGRGNKALVLRYSALYASGDLALADEVLAADFVDHSHPELPPGPEPVKRMVAAFRQAFPDATGTVEMLIAEGDMVAFRWILRGTHRGPWAGIAPTGRTCTLTGMDFVRIADGKIAELWSEQDALGFLRQLGMILRRTGT